MLGVETFRGILVGKTSGGKFGQSFQHAMQFMKSSWWPREVFDNLVQSPEDELEQSKILADEGCRHAILLVVVTPDPIRFHWDRSHSL